MHYTHTNTHTRRCGFLASHTHTLHTHPHRYIDGLVVVFFSCVGGRQHVPEMVVSGVCVCGVCV